MAGSRAKPQLGTCDGCLGDHLCTLLIGPVPGIESADIPGSPGLGNLQTPDRGGVGGGAGGVCGVDGMDGVGGPPWAAVPGSVSCTLGHLT